VADLPQRVKKQQASSSVATIGAATSPRVQPRANCSLAQFLVSQGAQAGEPTALNLSVTSRHPAKKGEIPLECGGSLGGARLMVFASRTRSENGRE
jgi:hypothetical protein